MIDDRGDRWRPRPTPIAVPTPTPRPLIDKTWSFNEQARPPRTIATADSFSNFSTRPVDRLRDEPSSQPIPGASPTWLSHFCRGRRYLHADTSAADLHALKSTEDSRRSEGRGEDQVSMINPLPDPVPMPSPIPGPYPPPPPIPVPSPSPKPHLDERLVGPAAHAIA